MGLCSVVAFRDTYDTHGYCNSPGTQELLDTPNPNSPAQSDAYVMLLNQRSQYDKRVRQQSRNYPPPV